MSSRFWSFGVPAPAEHVIEQLARWPHARLPVLGQRAVWRVELADLPRGPQAHEIGLAVREEGGWSHVLVLRGQPPIPDLILHLSRALATRVISAYADESVGYEHFSLVDRGAVVQLFTSYEEDLDLVGVDCVELYQRARALGSIKVRPPGPETPEDLEWEARSSAFGIWVGQHAEVDVHSRWIGDDLEGAVIHRLFTDGAEARCLSSRAGGHVVVQWSELTP